MDIIERIDNATVGLEHSAAIMGRGAFGELSRALKGRDRVSMDGLHRVHLLASIRGREVVCILEDDARPYEIRGGCVDEGSS